jgi:hypothetical protein
MKEYKRTCPKCNEELSYSSYKTHHQAIQRNSVCKSCRTTIANKSLNRNQKRENNPAWKGYNEIPYGWFSNYFERKSKRKQKTGDINIKQVYDLWINQNKKCALSGISIGFYDDGHNHTCSIDRIDSSKDYTIDNIQLVHKDINIMKNKYNQDYFISICQKIVNHNNQKK